ncbi:bifunctional (p)ppGpp synthetase/guanosine-3',5'-bis(diphosphate) 3'-pyrophosphohydrolase [Polynucleobacter sp. IMCC 29146]|uniref:RelA/SpoT family protein n=1 Tax=Polynucleobacter sp. IMCC 29146 TaxID=2780953 RepID=UPI001F282A6B|nr:HD domain-containing protein [Polynucleobacter sp. IMCC 29146]MCE7528798.1 HD domain-containing protein [Polynucleobacter sp. IMCC 29146]
MPTAKLTHDLMLDSWYGEGPATHARGVHAILQALGLDASSLIAASHIHHEQNKEALVKLLGTEAAQLLLGFRGLRQAQAKLIGKDGVASVVGQEEMLRKMLLAFGSDLRVVLIYLASRLQSLRWITQMGIVMPSAWAQTILEIDASLANRLGIWQMKWEMEDLAFRLVSPADYRNIAKMLDAKRTERESLIKEVIAQLQAELAGAKMTCEVQGRPKHIYSIWKKMQGKSLDFANLYDVRAFRVVVHDIQECYSVLGLVHQLWQPIPREFDDYIARPKLNGYQSLHTVVMNDAGVAFEIQIRTQAMHQQAEFGLAAHWRYKEGQQQGTQSAASAYEQQIAWARQLIAWKEDAWEHLKHHELDGHIYVLTPLGKVIALEKGSTPIDFAYAVHTDLGHRCRGAHVDGAMVPLDTPLANGQTVDIIAVKHGGPSRDWISPDRSYLQSHRARSKVRAWFNALDDESLVPANKAPVETKTVKPLESIVLHPGARQGASHSDVLVVGMDSLLTQLARCCRPVPPDAIVGFVTLGRGVSIHRRSCKTFLKLLERAPERVIQTAWNASVAAALPQPYQPGSPNKNSKPLKSDKQDRLYPTDLTVLALDRPELLRELFEIITRQGVHVIDLRKSAKRGQVQIVFTLEISNTAALRLVQNSLEDAAGVLEVQRR